MAVGTYELSIENWTYGSDETYPKRVLQDFKKVPFFLKIAYCAPLNVLRLHTAWSKKTTLLQRFLGHDCLQHYTWVALPGVFYTEHIHFTSSLYAVSVLPSTATSLANDRFRGLEMEKLPSVEVATD